MKKHKYSLIFWSAMVLFIASLTGCDGRNEGPLADLNINDGTTVQVDENLNRWVQTYFETRLAYLVTNDAQKTNELRTGLETFFDSKESFKTTLAKLDEEKAFNAALGIEYLSGSVEAKVSGKASQKVSDLQEIEAVTFATMPTTEIDSETGSPVVSAGFSVFELAIATSGAQWTITNETETTPWTTGIADSLGKEAAEMMAEWHDDEVAEPGLGTVLKVESYNYSGTAAARWAIKYFETSNVSGYYYFPIVGNNGGDCTNFICWCLRHGGWQMTANWHYTGSGSSCNDYSCQRTPSWAGANEFNMYITNRGQYAGVNGNNRVQQLFAGLRVPLKNSWMGVLAPGPNQNFVNEIKKLRVGDIVQIGHGSPAVMSHSMIVTKVYSQKPWVKVTYHSSDKLNHPIVDLTPFSKLYGYRIKSSGY